MAASKLKREREALLKVCANEKQLHEWVALFLGMTVPRHAVCPGHDAPFEYLKLAYFEPAEDAIVWAPRGGGKTRLGAAATLLDLLHKPGVQVRILGGSLEQSHRMWEHLMPDAERLAAELIDRQGSGRQMLQLTSGSRAGVLAQSQRAVRGLRVQKLRCDEVEMFDKAVWQAAQLITRSMKISGSSLRSDTGVDVRGTIEGMSTWHKPWGLMNGILERARERGTRILHWCILDVLEKCPQERACEGCPLWDDCGGVAKTKCAGFFSIEDAIVMKKRVSREAWESEMLCKRPNVEGRVFPWFEESVHVAEEDGQPRSHEDTKSDMRLAMDFGFRAPFVCLWIRTAGGVTHVVDEYVQSGRMLHEHVKEIEGRAWGKVRVVACDPAGAGPNEQTAESNIALLRRGGYVVRSRGSAIADGIEMIRVALKPAYGEATLFVHPRCQRLIKALLGYHHPASGGEKPEKDGEHDHLIDALRYHFVNRVGTGVKQRRY